MRKRRQIARLGSLGPAEFAPSRDSRRRSAYEGDFVETLPKVSATILADRRDSRYSALAICLIVNDVCGWWRMLRTPRMD